MGNKEYNTSGRKHILDFLIDNKDRTVTVSDIASHLEGSGNPVNATTIYRYLDKLSTDGEIVKYIADKGNMTSFQYASRDHKCDEHLHLKCIKCGSITHLDCDFMDEISHHIEIEHGFRLQCKNSVLYGICTECQKRT